jgi:hypothetical protein
VFAAAVPVSAQQSADPLRSQIMTFEDVLKRAIELAGEDFSAQVQQQLRPAFPIQFGFDPPGPVVRGWPIDSYGYHFDVQVPDVAETGMLLLSLVPRQAPSPARRPDAETRPVASGGVVKDDPMVSGPASPRAAAPASGGTGGGGTFDPNTAYRENVRSALIDAILNNPGVLNLRANDVLAVSAAGVGQTPLYRLSPRSARLTLYFSGADLIALREGRLTRDEAKKRIREQTF